MIGSMFGRQTDFDRGPHPPIAQLDCAHEGNPWKSKIERYFGVELDIDLINIFQVVGNNAALSRTAV